VNMKNSNLPSKQTILIAGATGSIGGVAAVALAKRGNRVVLLGRNSNKLKAKAELIRASLNKNKISFQEEDIDILEINFSDMESVRHAAEESLSRFPEINCLILSVGAYIQKGPNLLPSGHEVMFATNVLGPFLFTQLLIDRMQRSDGLVLHVIAPFSKEIDWNDIESIQNHRTMTAFNRTKTCNRVIAGELARRYEGKISSVAFDPTYVIDKSDPDLGKRWPSGPVGFFWHVMTILFARPPAIAGEPIADLIISHQDRRLINGALFKLNKRIGKPNKAMNDENLGKRLWKELVRKTGLGTG
jgi:NAD(P)-dependent dehydrogenase (short-subunit alcohol dehydrogenase family)